MIEIARETDIDQLRRIAGLLDRENLRLITKIEELSQVITVLSGLESVNTQLVLEILEEIRVFRQRTFEPPAEPEDPAPEEPSSEALEEPEAADEDSEAAQSGHGPRPQERLPRETKDWELPETQRECEICQGSLEEMKGQYEESEEVTVKEREFTIVIHRRQKYRCRCNSNVVTAPGPLKLIPGGRYSVEFAAEIATAKYLDHLPLERQSRILEREGLEISSQTLWDQLNALATVLEPSYNALKGHVLSAPVVFADETRWRYMQKKSSKNWFVWCIANHNTVFYKIFDNRSASCASELLSGYSGVVMADGYGVYESLARAGPSDFLLSHCWAHALRKFREIKETYPKECSEVLGLIGELYQAERNADKTFPSARESVRLQRRREERDSRSRALVGKIRQWAFDQMGKALPKSSLGQAAKYLLNMWDGLTLFLDNPRIPLDNNAAERALRGVVVGRKNHYGSRSKRGTQVAAVLYSLLETAKLRGVEPKAYLLEATRAALKCPGTVTLPEPST